MFKGTKNHKFGEFSGKVSEIGGDENAFTSYDFTAYYQTSDARGAADHDGVRVRSHAQPDPDR